ncbi:MAG: RNA-dependent DNA polymerase [Moorea sp. SIO4G3]|nr:reverse transcriptase domain-containing protein [Moorena sp. SIO4G3]NEO82502.1 RNA-dependent DNA polymerase [Moorena sp. SIO4G3]
MVRHSKASELWKGQRWKELRRNLFRLQKRVYKAMRAGDYRKVRSLQRLIMKSRSAQLLAVRQVTQLNKGKKTAGIDGKSSLSYRQRLELTELLNQKGFDWKHNGLREKTIPKKNGKTRTLKIPTIADRAWQCLVKFALEPAHEALFHERSYGFRSGRGAHDAQRYIFSHLQSNHNGYRKRVIELDIKKCFDRIFHKTIMERVICPRGISIGLFRCLKAGVSPDFPEQGTPQGGVVSPLLANIALDGIEAIHPSVRYADDMVIFLKPNDNAEEILEKISTFLTSRGMEISQEKTRITKTTDGFDFLGWKFLVQKNRKCKITPSTENFQAFREKIKAIINSSQYGAMKKAELLAPIVRGWRNYHRYCNMKGTRDRLWFPAKKAETVFRSEPKINRYQSKELINKAFPKVSWKENGHVVVKGDKSPYNGDIVYWSRRKSKFYDGLTTKHLKKQDHKCGYCGLRFISDESVHLHHIDGNHDNWKPKNLQVVHRSCHQLIHYKQSKT